MRRGPLVPFVSRLIASALVPLLLALAETVAAQPTDEPGMRFEVRADALPKPYATASGFRPPEVIARPEGVMPRVPDGFTVNVFAQGLDNPRWMALAPNGDVFLSEPNEGKVTVLRDADRNGVAEKIATFMTGLNRPHGLAFHEGALYIADTRAVWRVPYRSGASP
jgi:glucose/arabinose dehydrogenase